MQILPPDKVNNFKNLTGTIFIQITDINEHSTLGR